MTYKELLEMLNELSSEQLNQTVTVHHHFSDEYYPINHFAITFDNDVLDDNHLVLTAE